MKRHKAAALIPPILAALAIVALTLYAYRGLSARAFAADDYQWLLSVRSLSFGALLGRAFDPAAQTHFYRPLIWLLFWLQTRAFGLDPRGFHTVSLALHLLNAFLLGWLFYRLTGDEGRTTNDETRYPWSFVLRPSSALIAGAIVALHPAPFEAVVWIAAQSELLAAALLLAALHLWLCRRTTNDQRRTTKEEAGANPWSLVLGRWSVLATLALGLALLAKESAVIGLPLLMLIGQGTGNRGQETGDNKQETSGRNLQSAIYNLQSAITPYILPTLLTLAYVALQLVIERRNYLLEQGGYGLGTQLLLNPLRSLALLVAPLPGTEHADAAWLVPLGALVAVGLLGFWILDLRFWMRARREQSTILSPKSKIVLALGLTLLPTAPFASPPDSRYLYLPVMAGALLIGFWIYDFGFWITIRQSKIQNPKSKMGWLVLVTGFLVLASGWWTSSELHSREGRFAAASGPGGSLWQVATSACEASRPERMVVVEPPLAAPHVEAIVELACGPDVRARIVGRDQVEGAIKGRTLVIAFPHGSAEVQRWP
jgi:hypothetical protein